MKKIIIQDPESGLTGEIFPDYGGMLTRLAYKGKEIISTDETKLHTANVIAGGCPVLFPFPSRTDGDIYHINGKEYRMPFHGLVKNAAFGIREVTGKSATLFITNNEASMQDHFPFDFCLEVKYEVEDNHAVFIATVHNRSDKPMPHYFGWHHYFAVSDKKQFEIRTDMEEYKNYLDGSVHHNDGKLDLAVAGDYVFCKKATNETEVVNQADGYRVRIKTDDAFEALVVCTLFDGYVTAEPWLGTPDAINDGNYVKWVAPYSSESYKIVLELSVLDT